MKLYFVLLILLITVIPTQATEFSVYTEKQYQKDANTEHVHIVVKKEIIEIFAQEVGKIFIPYIVYGYGDLKIKNHKKERITYICLLNKKLNPIWSCVYKSE